MHEEKQKGRQKIASMPVKIITGETLPKPDWIRVRAGPFSPRFETIRAVLKKYSLVTVCDEANCPNKGECFENGTATFMILGDRCTRRCPFCNVAHGKPGRPDPAEPDKIAQAAIELNLSHVVITSVTRDDLPDGGAGHFADCIRKIRKKSHHIRIEILTPDFRGHEQKAIENFSHALPDVFNHNLETVPRLYRLARPGASYLHSLAFLKRFRQCYSDVITKSGLMVGLGESDEEILKVMGDLREHDVSMLTIGQYLMPSKHHLPVTRYVHPDTFEWLREEAYRMGFVHVASGPLVRSSYHADLHARDAKIT